MRVSHSNLKRGFTGFLTLILLGALFSCAARKIQKRQEFLGTSVEYYNKQMRWKNYGAASEFVDKEKINDFLKYHEANRDTLNVMEVRMISAKVDKENPNKGTAQIWMTYYHYPNASLKNEMLVQNWNYDEDGDYWHIELPELEQKPKK